MKNKYTYSTVCKHDQVYDDDDVIFDEETKTWCVSISQCVEQLNYGDNHYLIGIESEEMARAIARIINAAYNNGNANGSYSVWT